MFCSPDEHTETRHRLTGKVAIVAGAGAIGEGWGNGKATAFVYGKEGAKVFCVDNRLKALKTPRNKLGLWVAMPWHGKQT
ncbi:MAG: hypothetical protein VYA17_08800 [Pseudomonadota bacterium]|nr:hypothetical protein [Pseudomonadota bacterium]